jgi:hypothetical protein
MQLLKKITLLSLLFVSAFSYAQETGPSKEVTVQSINKYMNEAVGMEYYIAYSVDENGNRIKDENGNYLYDKDYFAIIDYTLFSLEKVSRKTANKEKEGTYTEFNDFSNIKWENITSVDTTGDKSSETLTKVRINFSSKIKWHWTCYAGTYNVSCDQTEYYDGFGIYIPKNRVAACYKALMHLKELCTVEDPFED